MHYDYTILISLKLFVNVLIAAIVTIDTTFVAIFHCILREYLACHHVWIVFAIVATPEIDRIRDVPNEACAVYVVCDTFICNE